MYEVLTAHSAGRLIHLQVVSGFLLSEAEGTKKSLQVSPVSFTT